MTIRAPVCCVTGEVRGALPADAIALRRTRVALLAARKCLCHAISWHHLALLLCSRQAPRAPGTCFIRKSRRPVAAVGGCRPGRRGVDVAAALAAARLFRRPCQAGLWRACVDAPVRLRLC